MQKARRRSGWNLCFRYGREDAGFFTSRQPSVKGNGGKELYTRHADVKDRRNTRVYLTEAGREKQEECRKILNHFTEQVIDRMGEENMLQLLDLFNQMVDVMEDELKKTEKGDRIC